MSTVPLLSSVPITVGGRTFDPKPDLCFSCTPPYKHRRAWVPEVHSQRTVVLCFDGTGDSFDKDNTNVVNFVATLKKDDPTTQLVYYQAGIGTYTNIVLKTPIAQTLSKTMDKMFAWEMSDHIKDGYMFLMQNYRPGDQICIFGFSRGAYTARALAGMLQKVGLLPPCNVEHLPFAYAMYAKDNDENLEESLHFKRAFSIDVRIRFLGVWDTVQSVGLVSKHLPFCGSNNAISYFRHALALDERRVKFIPSFCTSENSEEEQGTESKDSEHDKTISEDSHYEIGSGQPSGPSEFDIKAMAEQETDIEEVFFAGAHCDVGGGSVKNNERHSLARIPLRWMIRECFKATTGIIFDAHMLKHEVGLNIDSLFVAPERLPSATRQLERPKSDFSIRKVPKTIASAVSSPFRWIWRKVRIQPTSVAAREKDCHRWVSKGEDREDLNDALSPIYDRLKIDIYWWIPEWFPWIIRKQIAEVDGDRWAYHIVWNRGEGRKVFHRVMQRRMKVHRSVKTRIQARRMEGEKEPYLPKIRCVFKVEEGKYETRPLTREEWLAEKPEHFNWVD